MISTRFLPDLVVQAGAIGAGLLLLRRLSGWRRWGIAAGTTLTSVGLCMSFLQAEHIQLGYRGLLFSGLGVAWSLSLLGAIAIRFALPKRPVNPGRRELLAKVAMAAPAAMLTTGMLVGRKQFHLEEIDMPIAGLHPDLDGLRLVQLSDIHLSPFLSRSELAYCVDLANDTRAHAAFVTGDLITGVHDSIDDCLDELRRLRADAGIYGCMGNHELYIHAEDYTQREAARRGMNFLRQQQTELRFGSASINLAGLDYKGRKPLYLGGADKLLRPHQFNLLLNHNPDVFEKAAEQGWDLTLAGHMHGGQINIELAQQQWNLARFKTPYVYGTYRMGKSAIYVTRGIGTVAMPTRLGAPPEVALIRLRRTDAGQAPSRG
jgi:predicted MPP superfamily phosphohydrolase